MSSTVLYSPETYVTCWWEIKVFDNFGVELADFREATAAELTFPLDGVDSCQFNVYFDDPNIDPTQGGDPTILRSLDRTVKVWRHIRDPINNKTYDDPPNTPCFAGPIYHVEWSGSNEYATVIAQSPLWRLQSRFHIDNHYLVIDYAGQTDTRGDQGGNMDGQPWDISALMFRLIDLVNGAFGNPSRTGIVKPTSGPPYWPKTLEMGPFSVAMGDNTWTRFQELQALAGGPDLVPQYINDGTSDLMYFKTSPTRGNDRTATVSFDYYTGNFNCDDFDLVDEVVPDSFANYVWSVGQGSYNTTKEIAYDGSGVYGGTAVTDDGQAIENVGIYMTQIQSESVDVAPGGLLDQLAQAQLRVVSKLPYTYTVTPSPLTPPYFGLDFFLGDKVSLNAVKRGFVVSGQQRVTSVDITLSDNLVEQYTLILVEDFYNQVTDILP